jgi:LacI family transcriptional regulator
MSVERLLSLGHRRIAILPGPRELIETRSRELAFAQAMEQCGTSALPDRIVPSIYGQDMPTAGEVAIEKLFSGEGPKPTAIIVVNNHRAIGVLRGLQSREVRVPQDVSMIVIAGDRLPGDWPAKFTRVFMDSGQVGHAAVDLLLDEDAHRAPRRVLIAPTMCEGDTAAPAPV